jgi:hypothetical protein
MIAYGLIVEKWYVSKYSVASNLWTLILALLSLGEVDIVVRLLVSLYCIAGMVVVLFRGKLPSPVTWLFGSRFVGACLLALTFLNEHWPLLWVEVQPLAVKFSSPAGLATQTLAIVEWGVFFLVLGFLVGPILPSLGTRGARSSSQGRK